MMQQQEISTIYQIKNEKHTQWYKLKILSFEAKTC